MQNTIRAAGLAVLAPLLLVACGGGGGGTTPTPGFTVTVPSGILSILQAAAGTTRTGTVTVTIGRTNSFTGTVNLSVSSLPSGVDASFSPAAITSSTTSTTLTVTIAASVAPGSYTFTVSGTAVGADPHSGTVSLTVTALPPAILLTGPTALTIQAGRPGLPVTIDIARTNFPGNVSLAVLSGVPTGVTTSIATSPTTAASAAVTFTSDVFTTPGTYPVVLQGSGSGITSVTVPLSLTVSPAAFVSLLANPASITIFAGGTSSGVPVFIARSNYPDPVTITATGMPSGATPTVTTSPTTADQVTLSFIATAATVPGTYAVTVTASGTGILPASIPFSLTINAAAGIALTFSRNPASVAQGASGTTSVMIARTNFTGAVMLAAAGMPNDVGASFGVNPTGTNGSVLTFMVGAGVPVGSYPIVVTGSGAGINPTMATVMLNVTLAPPAPPSGAPKP